MLETLFTAYLQLSLAMTPVLLLLWIVVRTGKSDGIKAADRRVLWCVLTVQLLLPLAGFVPNPITVPMPDEIQNIGNVYAAEMVYTDIPAAVSDAFPAENTGTADGETDTQSISAGTGTGMSVSENTVMPEEPVPAEQNRSDTVSGKTSVLPEIRILSVLSWIWLCAALGKILRQTVGYIRFCRILDREGCAVPEWNGVLESLCRNMGLRRVPRLIRCAAVGSPMLCGCFRPVIVLPDMPFSEREICAILCHELIHRRRGDLVWKWLAMFGGAVHWFNPLVLWAVRRFDLVTELACDEAALARMDDSERLAYGEVILSILRRDTVFSESRMRYSAGIAAGLTTRFTQGKSSTRERLLYILQKPERKHRLILLTLAVLLALCAGLVSCETEAAEPDAAVPAEKAIPTEEPIWEAYKNDTPGRPTDREDHSYTFVPMDENPDWMLQVHRANGTLELIGREGQSIVVENKIPGSEAAFFRESPKTKFYMDEAQNIAVIVTQTEDTVAMSHCLLISLETESVIRYLEAPFAGEPAYWLDTHGVPASAYTPYGDNFVSETSVTFGDGAVYLQHTLASGDMDILVSGMQIFSLTGWNLSAYQPGYTQVPEGVVPDTAMTDERWIRENLYTDFGLREQSADPASLGEAELAAYMEEAYLAALGIYELHEISTYGMFRVAQTDMQTVYGNYSLTENPVFHTMADWEGYIRGVLSEELADRLMKKELYIDYNGALAGQLTARTRVLHFRDGGHLVKRVSDGEICFSVLCETIDMDNGAVLQVRKFDFTYEKTEEGWRWTKFTLLT